MLLRVSESRMDKGPVIDAWLKPCGSEFYFVSGTTKFEDPDERCADSNYNSAMFISYRCCCCGGRSGVAIQPKVNACNFSAKTGEPP